MSGTVAKQTLLGSGNSQVGRDHYEGCTFNGAERVGGLSELLKTLENKIKDEPEAGEFIKLLLEYIDKMEERKIVGLEAKLNSGNRTDLYEDAARCKTMFAKRLHKDELSVSAQTAYAHILSWINSSFGSLINPMIRDGESARDIDEAIYNKIISPLYDIVATSSLGVTMDHIRGMLYYLTGNCYISWKK